ncbi:unnamed protein product [Phaedon cochleariae]|uniref:Hemolymph juvenile hormone binding protein n=1 Tax=Phaedon cochleariae TaxID=80249 RepID=A0A9P0DL96_PHACE|nr:unnamed protein product [Phaedon cochleariae]
MRITIIVPLQLLLLFSISVIRGYVFPDDFKICKSIDPNLDGCLAESIQDALFKLANPGIHSPINLTISKVTFPYFLFTPDDSEQNTTIECFNLTYPDLWQARVKNVSVDLCNPALDFTTNSAEITAFIQRFKMLGKINQQGKPEPKQGDGAAIIRYYNVTMKHSLKFKLTEKDNEKYLDVTSYNVKISISRSTIFFGDVVEDNVALEEDALAKMDHQDVTLEGNQKKRFQTFGALMFRGFAGQLINSVPMDRIITDWSKACVNSTS